MNLQDIAYPLGEFLVWSFGLLQMLDNLPNFLIVLVGCGGISFWLMLQSKYNQKARLTGGLK